MIESKKRVLLFCPNFFGYDKRLYQAIQEEGFEVDLYDERPSNSFFGKLFLRLNLGFYKTFVRKYLRGIIEENQGKKYDYIFMIKSEAAGEKEVAILREAYPEAKFILYFWDAVENIPDGEKKIGLYDRVLTFDRKDAEKYSLIFRPLFFGKDYEAKEASAKKDYAYEFAFIGTAHSDRPKIVKILGEKCTEKGLGYFSFLFLPHPMLFFYNKILNRDYRGIKMHDVTFQRIDSKKITDIYENSRCVLDVEHTKQNGLTMRTIELIGMKKKIITTNTGIREYDFFNPVNICVIDRKNPKIDDEFLSRPYEEIPSEIMNRYTLRSFIRDIFDLKEE